MTRCSILAIAFLPVLLACDTRDPCLDAHRQLVASPSGTRRLNIFAGSCPNAAPQILVEFDHGAAGTGVFAVNDSVMDVRARWIDEDTVEISYSRQAHVVKKESFAQNRSQRVTVKYVVLPD